MRVYIATTFSLQSVGIQAAHVTALIFIQQIRPALEMLQGLQGFLAVPGFSPLTRARSHGLSSFSLRCPPEDCGGEAGYENVLRVLKSARTRDDREFKEWVGDYDPESFDLQSANQFLQG